MRYKQTSKKKKNGVVYTPIEMADYVAKEMIKYGNKIFNDKIEILDPAVGEGELLLLMVKALKEKFPNEIRVVGYETDKNICKKTEERLKKLFPDSDVIIKNEDFLKAVENGTVGK